MAYRIFFHDDKRFPYQIQYVAERICELKCDTGDAAMFSYIQDLCALHFLQEFPNRIYIYQNDQTNLERDVARETLPLDIILAAVCLRLPYSLAAFNGDLELIKGLLANEPEEAKVDDDIQMNFLCEMIVFSTLGRQAEVLTMLGNASLGILRFRTEVLHTLRISIQQCSILLFPNTISA